MTNQRVKKWIEINIGLLLAAVGIAFFFWPASFVTGGGSGLAILLELVFDKISNVVYLYTIDIILLILSLFTLGKGYFFKTLYSTLMLPTMVMIMEWMIKKCGWFDTLKDLDIWIIVIFGAVTTGVGVGLNLRNDGGTGGIDVLQSIFYKVFHIPYSVSNYVFNGAIILGGIAINGIENGLCAFIYLFILGYIIDSITFGGFNRRAVFIQSKYSKEIKNTIINDLVRGCSSLHMQGGYSGSEGEMLVVVCLTREYLELRNAISKIDPYAFIFVTRAEELRGLGFTAPSPARIESRKNRKKGMKKEE